MLNFVMLIVVSLFTDGREQEHGGDFLTDQRGKYVVMHESDYEITQGYDFSVAIRDFFKEQPMVLEKKDQLFVNGKAKLKSHAVIGNYVAGEVLYRLVFEKTTVGYRYWFTDLAYQPYVKDRYGKLVKAAITPIPLERKLSKINQRVWERQQASAYETIQLVSEKLDRYLQQVGQPKTVEIP
ncbi:hypothetical protein GCM10023231_15610 [Olivibacter ginsenosidimutans]|uniref:DUF4468 domain-containing protein n=1 Tax=Olivibacter ginsenosidimutans TaxID=1176537 RepID=A0ABP9B0I1_9SPHI